MMGCRGEGINGGVAGIVTMTGSRMKYKRIPAQVGDSYDHPSWVSLLTSNFPRGMKGGESFRLWKVHLRGRIARQLLQMIFCLKVWFLMRFRRFKMWVEMDIL